MKSDISGFPEFLPNEQIAFNKAVDTIKSHFELYGFVPMDTPAVERISTLLAKGNDSEIYGLYRLASEENDKKELGLRFDLTVPLARYVSLYNGHLTFPHKRYQIAPVWRGERPQFGRYRQFYQCDVDIIGNDELSTAHDAEIISLINNALLSLNIPKFSTKINNRKILGGFLKTIVPESKVTDIIRIIDKIDKISSKEFVESIKNHNVDVKDITKIRNFLDIEEKKLDNSEMISWLKGLSFNAEFASGASEVEEVINLLKKFGINDKSVKISMKLARGLAYYTGNVFETSFDDIKDMGSIAGGGRYDDLAAMVSDKKFPGVGGTIGISRLIPKLLESGYIKCDKFSTAQLLVTVQNRNFIGSYMKLSEKFRKLGIKTETYLQEKNLGSQLSYADKKGIKHVLIANDVELLENKAIIRNMETKEQTVIRTEYMNKEIINLLNK